MILEFYNLSDLIYAHATTSPSLLPLPLHCKVGATSEPAGFDLGYHGLPSTTVEPPLLIASEQ